MRASLGSIGAAVVTIAGGVGAASADTIHIQAGETHLLDTQYPTLTATTLLNEGTIRAEALPTTTLAADGMLTNNGLIEAVSTVLELDAHSFTHHGVIRSTGTGARIDLNPAARAGYTITGTGRWEVGNGMSIDHPAAVHTTGEFQLGAGTIVNGVGGSSFTMSVLAGGDAASSFYLGDGSTVTILSGDAAKPYHGNLTGGLRLVKNGPGTQVLTGEVTHGGGTEINGGLLQVNHATTAAGYGDVVVNAGGALGGSGNVGAYTHVHTGGTLAPGAKKPGELSFFGLYLHEGSGLELDLAATGSSDLVRIANSVIHVGGTTVHIRDASAPGGLLGDGLAVGDTLWFLEYDTTWVVDAAGNRTDDPIDAADFTLGARPAGLDGHFVAESDTTGGLDYGRVGFHITAVPEPASLTALVAASLALFTRRRK